MNMTSAQVAAYKEAFEKCKAILASSGASLEEQTLFAFGVTVDRFMHVSKQVVGVPGFEETSDAVDRAVSEIQKLAVVYVDVMIQKSGGAK